MIENDTIYKKILDDFHIDLSPTPIPHLDLVFAQPGAGKTTLTTNKDKTPFTLETAVRIDVDQLYAYQAPPPSFTPFNPGHQTEKQAFEWYERLLTDSVLKRTPIVLEGGPRRLLVGRAAAAIKENNYTVTLHGLAVHWRQSLLGIMERFEDNLAKGKRPRWIHFNGHNKSYFSNPYAALLAGISGKAQTIRVYNRTGHLLAHETGRLGTAKGVQAFQAECNRKWTQDEMDHHRESVISLWQTVRSHATERPDWYLQLIKTFYEQAETMSHPYRGAEVFHLPSLLALTRLERR